MRKTSVNLDDLSNHSTVTMIAEDYLPVVKIQRKGGEYASLTDQQKYRYDIGFRMGQVLNQLERIQQADTLLDSYPYIKSWRRQFGQTEYFQYHMETYYLAVAGLVDRLLLLINELCRLGIDPVNTRMNAVLKALEATKYKNIALVLGDLRTETAEIKRMRNKLAHAQRFHEKDLYHINVLEFSLRQEMIDDVDGFLKDDLDLYIKTYRSQKKKQIQTSNDNLIPLLKRLLDAFEATYIKERDH